MDRGRGYGDVHHAFGLGSASSSNCAAISGSSDRRRLSASTATNLRKFGSMSPGGSSNSSTSSRPSGMTQQRSARADQPRRWQRTPSSVRPRARDAVLARQREGGAGVGSGERQRMAHRLRLRSELGREVVEQGLVGTCVDLALDQLLGTGHGQGRHLLAQVFLGAVRGGRDLRLGQRLLALGLGYGLVLGRVDDLVRTGFGLGDDLVCLAARVACSRSLTRSSA
jgi:hypothetical protein